MNYKYLLTLASALWFLACAPPGVAGVTVPPATYSVGLQCGGSGGPSSTPASASCSLPEGELGDVSYSGSANGSPSVSVAMALSSNIGFGLPADGNADAYSEYWMEWVGPAGPNIPTLFRVSGHGDVSVDASVYRYGLYGELSLGGLGNPLAVICSAADHNANGEYFTSCGGPYPPITSAGTTVSASIPPNTAVSIFLDANMGNMFCYQDSSDGNCVLLASLFIDPYIYADPSFPLASDYTLVLSDGVGNSPQSSIPEPATLTFLGSALVWLGLITRRRLNIAVVCAVAIGLLAAVPAMALPTPLTLPPPLYGIDVGQGALTYSYGQPLSGANSVLYGSTGGFVSDDATAGNAPLAFASEDSVDLPAEAGKGSAASVTYYYAVSGPPGITVPIRITAKATADVTWSTVNSDQEVPAGADAKVVVGGENGSYFYIEVCAYSNAPSCLIGPDNGTVNVLSDTIYGVDLTASAYADAVGRASAAADALADPYLYIDPSFPLASEFTLVISGGVGNTPPSSVPEPSALMLLSAGLAGFSFMRRQRWGRTWLIMVFGSIGALFTGTALAGSLPNAIASVTLQDDSDSLQQVGINVGSSNPTSFTLGAISPISGGILASGAIDPIAAATISYPTFTTVQVPALNANSIIEGVSGTNQSTATVDLNYNFIISGPPNVEVPIILWLNHGIDAHIPRDENVPDASWGLQGTDTVDLQGPQDGNANAFQTLGHEVLEAGYDSNHPQDAYDTYTSSYSLTGFTNAHVTSDSIETIDMQATSYAVFSTAGLASGSINTIVDPYITIDPSFPLADEFTIEVSPYIGNDLVSSGPASVPEPGVFTLLGTASLATILLARSRRHFLA